jgi:tRNA U34 5-carboxymethylaminomethyl modifying GTPase MnmE/TrmE
MLTKQDLNAIGNLIESKLEEKLESKFEEKLAPIHNDIKTIKKDVTKLRKDLTKTINFFDSRDLENKKSLDKTRSEIGLQRFDYA